MGEFMKSALDILSRNLKEEEQGFVGESIEVSGFKLKVKKFLAAGGFSNVYLVADTKGEQYAVKRLTGYDKEGCDKILNEINLHKNLNNVNIVKFHGVSYMQKNLGTLKIAEYLLLTELCSQSLTDIVHNDLSLNAILTIMNQAVNAIQFLHNMKPAVIHRDIKLENFLISTEGTLKLCDFGSATTDYFELNEDWNMQKRSNLQDEIFTNTSPMYRAPEILDTWNNYPIGPKVDIWALGCIFYCILFKKHPFDDAAKLKIVNANYSIPNIPKYQCFHNLVRGCFIVDPRKRCNSTQISKQLLSIGIANDYRTIEKINLNEICKQKVCSSDTAENSDRGYKPTNEKNDHFDLQKRSDDISSVQSLLNTNGLLSSIKDGANVFLKNFIGTSSKVLSSIQTVNPRTNNILNLTSRIIVSNQSNIEILQKYLENSFLPSNISVYNFSNSNSRLPPPVRTININQHNNNFEAKVLDLEHLYYLVEEMFGFLNSGEKYVLVLQENKDCNITVVIVCALFLYAGLTELIEDALQIFAVKVHPISLFPSEFRYLNYIKNIVNGDVPHNRSVKLFSFYFNNYGDFQELIGDCKLLIQIFENNRLVLSQDQYTISNDSKVGEIKLNNELTGNVLVIVTISKLSTKFSDKNAKLIYCKMQFHTGFLSENGQSLTFSKEDLDLEKDFDFNFLFFIKYSLATDDKINSKKWGITLLQRDPKVLFRTLLEYNEIVENFIGNHCSQATVNDIAKFSDIHITEKSKHCNNENVNNMQSSILPESKKKIDIPILLDLSADNSEDNMNLENPNNYENNLKDLSDSNSEQLLDIFDQSYEEKLETKTIPKSCNEPNIIIDPFVDLFENLVNSNNVSKLNSEDHHIKIEAPSKENDSLKIQPPYEKPIYSETFAELSKSSSNSNIFDTSQQKNSPQTSDFFADLLGQQGYSFAKKTSTEPKTINDLRKHELLSNMDEENIKIYKWTEGKRANIRALLCSMHTVLWDDAKWSKCEMHQLITLAEVKKAYRKACLAVHPDKHVGTENENLSKMIFMELNTAWGNFNAENS